ncbi:MAG: 1-acyl-sn-glycerol-3-phosphate acyltransferase [Planctomycetota bacterium]
MNRQPFEKPPRWWSPMLSPGWVRFWRPVRMRKQLKKQRLLEVEVRGLEHVREAVAAGHGVLITPNHASHADCYAFYTAADRLGYPFYVMIAWQNFVRDGRLKQLALRQHGGFSVDREGTDMRAFRQAVEILQSRPNPLTIFPEGDVYHVNDRITPFREGPAAMAIMAARKGSRPIVCIPCGIKYRYVEDPTPELLRLMADLERAIFWRPRPDLALDHRIYHFAEGVLALKEIEFLGHTSSGPVPKRVSELAEFILGQIGARYGQDPSGVSVPERVKSLRRHAIEQLEQLPEGDPRRTEYEDDLADLFMVVQAFSYPGDYVRQRPSVERMAETLDKFEEDVLGVKTATIRGARAATVTFGDPIPVDPARGKKTAAQTLTRTLEERVQGLLD